MSRVGKVPVKVPSGVSVTMNGKIIEVKGKLGTLFYEIPDVVDVTHENDQIIASIKSKDGVSRSLWGTARNRIKNMVIGVSDGFVKRIEVTGVGFRASVDGRMLILYLGFSHEIRYFIPEGVSVVAEKPTLLVISGYDKQIVGQVCSEIRHFRKPEPYKGKGIMFEGEKILRKEGKKK